VVTGNSEEEPIFLRRGQIGDPPGELGEIIPGVLARWTCRGRDLEQVGVEAEEVDQCLLGCGERCQPGRYGWFEFGVVLAVECAHAHRRVAATDRRAES